MSFSQAQWLKPYIDFNTEQRKMAKTEFEKNFFKLMVNSVFGKTMQDKKKECRGRLINEVEKNDI
jgi:hypothetical protein